MMNRYEMPEMHIIEIVGEEVITASGLTVVPSNTVEDNNKWSGLF